MRAFTRRAWAYSGQRWGGQSLACVCPLAFGYSRIGPSVAGVASVLCGGLAYPAVTTQRGPGSARDARPTIGELFPHDDPVAQWVFSLTAFAEDLHVGIKPAKEANDTGDLRALLFWQRHMVTRLYEARRLVTSARAIAEVDPKRGGPGGYQPGGLPRRDASHRPDDWTPRGLVDHGGLGSRFFFTHTGWASTPTGSEMSLAGRRRRAVATSQAPHRPGR